MFILAARPHVFLGRIAIKDFGQRFLGKDCVSASGLMLWSPGQLSTSASLVDLKAVTWSHALCFAFAFCLADLRDQYSVSRLRLTFLTAMYPFCPHVLILWILSVSSLQGADAPVCYVWAVPGDAPNQPAVCSLAAQLWGVHHNESFAAAEHR